MSKVMILKWKKVKYPFFNYQRWYIYIFNSLHNGDIFVEIGTWTGASSLFFGELLKKGNKKIKFYTIDTFRGSVEHKDYDLVVEGELYEYYLSMRSPLKKYIKVIKGDSQSKETSRLFQDQSIAAIFFDADHSYAGMKRDLVNWYPKIRKGGIISGHDYTWGDGGVKKAVDLFFKNNIVRVRKSIWHCVK